MNTNDLIAELARRATPVTPLPPPAMRLLRWSAIAAFAATVAVFVVGPRADLGSAAATGAFVRVFGLSLVVGVGAAFAALTLAIPGATRTPAVYRVPAAVFALLVVFATAAVVSAGHGLREASPWMHCAVCVLGVSLLPAAALWVMVERSAPLRPRLTAALAFMAAGSIGTLAIEIICPLTDSGHILIGHIVPVVLFAGVGVLMAGARHQARGIRH
jgi:hypothetical protein